MVARWKFTDPSDSSTFRLPVNPDQMSSVIPKKPFDEWGKHSRVVRSGTTLSSDSSYLVRQTKNEPVLFDIQGVIHTKDAYDIIYLWSQKQNRLTLVDHLNRTWTVQMKMFSTVIGRNPRRPWRQHYTLRMLLFNDI